MSNFFTSYPNAQSSHPDLHTIPRVYRLDQIAPRIRHEIQSNPIVEVGRRADIGEGVGNAFPRQPALQGRWPTIQG